MATNHTREQYVFLAKLAEQAERYDGINEANWVFPNVLMLFLFDWL